MLTYGAILRDFEKSGCTLEPHPDVPYKAIKKANGKYHSVTPDGTDQEADSPGIWERFTLSSNGSFAIAERWPIDQQASPDNTKVYVMAVAQW